MKKTSHETQLEFWRQQLQQLPDLHQLPLDSERPLLRDYRQNVFGQSINQPLLQRLNQLCHNQDVSLFMLFHATFALLLSRHANQNDIVIGTPVANRDSNETNTVVLRTDVSADLSFTQLLAQCKDHFLNAYEHRQLPFEQLVAELNPEPSTAYAPLCQVMLVFNDLIEPKQTSHYDLTLYVSATAQGLELSWQYATALFNATTISRMAESFSVLLQSIVENPNCLISKLVMLSTTAEQQLLQHSKGIVSQFEQNLCIHQLFEKRVREKPDAIAVVFNRQSLSYQALNQRANQLSHHLHSLGLTPNTLVGLCIERSLDMVVALLAIMKAGAAYVPLDPNYPSQRLAYILNDAAPQIILTQSPLLAQLSCFDGKTLCVDQADFWASNAKDNIDADTINLTSDHLAYVLYTSGSTGQPKGVMINHQNVQALLGWAHQQYTSKELSYVLGGASICFDFSVFELLLPLCSGGTAVLASSPLELIEQNIDEPITMVNAVPSVLTVLLSHDGLLNSVKVVNSGGEYLPQSLVEQLYSAGVEKVYDLYGPTEATVCSTFTLRQPNGIDNIGGPINNAETYICDSHGALVPVGVAGELYIGGAGLAQGYLNQQNLTAEKFVEHRFNQQLGAKLYKTGDMMCWLADEHGKPDQLRYLGRIDQQIKLRGMRIELAEIEAHILRLEGVETTCAVMRDTPERLVAFVVASSNDTIDINAMTQQLSSSLPAYMLPDLLQPLDQLPVMPNGKIDRQALIQLQIDTNTNTTSNVQYSAPESEIEQQLAEIWQSILSVEKIALYDNFFTLGGNSLLAVLAVVTINQRLSVKLPTGFLFKHPVLKDLADAIVLMQLKQKQGFIDHNITANSVEVVQLASGSQAPPLLCLHGVEIYQQLANQLAGFQDVYGLFIPAEQQLLLDMLSGKQSLDSAQLNIKQQAQQYSNAIKQLNIGDNYSLAGYCYGGFVAYETAIQLKNSGFTANQLILFGTEPIVQQQISDADEAIYQRLATRLKRNSLQDGESINSYVYTLALGHFRQHLYRKAARDYDIVEYDDAAIVFYANADRDSAERQQAWRNSLLGQLTHFMIQAEHETLMQQPAIEQLAELYRQRLEKDTSIVDE